MRKTALGGLILGCLFLTAGCRQDMHDQPKFKTYRANPFFADGRSARPLVEGTVARGNLQEDEHLYKGRENGEAAKTFPFPVTQDVLHRGQERFNIYCSPCHGPLGDGEGMIVQRGLKHPPSFHIDRLRDAPPGYFFTVITNGFGVMFDYSDRIPANDRWAIISYIRALQLSQHATLEDVPAEERQRLAGSH
jgi:mono/diheme cytochrome c family protein